MFMIDPIERDKAIQARAMTPAARFHMGFELFEMVRNRMLAGIRARSPELSSDEVEIEFRRILKLQRQQQEKSVYRTVDSMDLICASRFLGSEPISNAQPQRGELGWYFYGDFSIATIDLTFLFLKSPDVCNSEFDLPYLGANRKLHFSIRGSSPHGQGSRPIHT
jgi:hypothetical protein